MIISRQLDILRARDLGREIAPRIHRDRRIADSCRTSVGTRIVGGCYPTSISRFIRMSRHRGRRARALPLEARDVTPKVSSLALCWGIEASHDSPVPQTRSINSILLFDIVSSKSVG